MWSQKLQLAFPGTGQEHVEVEWLQSNQSLLLVAVAKL